MPTESTLNEEFVGLSLLEILKFDFVKTIPRLVTHGLLMLINSWQGAKPKMQTWEIKLNYILFLLLFCGNNHKFLKTKFPHNLCESSVTRSSPCVIATYMFICI